MFFVVSNLRKTFDMAGNDFIVIILRAGFKKGQICTHVLCISEEMDRQRVQLLSAVQLAEMTC